MGNVYVERPTPIATIGPGQTAHYQILTYQHACSVSDCQMVLIRPPLVPYPELLSSSREPLFVRYKRLISLSKNHSVSRNITRSIIHTMSAHKLSVVFLLSALAALIIRGSSAPTAPPTMPQFKILSLFSRRLVSITPNGDVHAKAGDSGDPSTNFYEHTLEFPKVSYESVQNRGMYLVLDDKTGQVRVETPEDDNEVFMKIQHPTMYGFYALRSVNNKDCYIAFDFFGSVSTNPSICDGDELHSGHGLHTSVHIYQM